MTMTASRKPATWLGRRPWTANHLVWLVCTALIVAILGFAGVSAWTARVETFESYQRNTVRLGALLSEQTSEYIRTIDLVLQGIQAHVRTHDIPLYQTEARAGKGHPDLANQLRNIPGNNALLLFDTGGRLLESSRPGPIPSISADDRGFFACSRESEEPRLCIDVAKSRVVGTSTIFFARRLLTANGAFAGVTAAAISVDDLERFYGSIARDSQTKITLARNDGLILAQYPPDKEGTDDRLRPGAMPPPRLQGEHDVFATTGGVDWFPDSVDRSLLLIVHPVEVYPLTIAIRVPKTEIFALWRKHTIGTSVAAFAVVICLGALFAMLSCHMTKTMQAETALRSSQEVLDGILNAIPVRVFWKDRDLGYLGCNAAFAHDAGLSSPHDLIGKSDYDMVWRDQADLYRADDRRVIESGQSKLLIEEPQTTPEGKTITLLTSKIPLRGRDGEVNGVLGTYMDITEKREAEATIAHLARHDALTGLPNRLLFRESLERTLAYARPGQLLALHCLDLDQFKEVNDTLGHPVGDTLLRAVAERLERSLRETDFVARLGGDEFAVVQTMLDSPDGATDLANRLVKCLKMPFEIDDHHLIIGTSIGIAIAPQDGTDADRLLKSADQALYQAKADGRGVWCFFRPEMDEAMVQRCALESDLRQALQSQQLELFYQPLVDVRSGQCLGCEALLRWRHPTKGLITPDHFIPLAEETGLIRSVGAWVLREACKTAAGWPYHLKVAINLSAVQFKDENLLSKVDAALDESGLPADRLELEITESVILQDSRSTLATLQQLRQRGVRIALDDFGTGYSSLSYLRRFPFDRVKIDKSFVRDLDQSRDCTAIVHAVTALGQELGMEVTAEGVETSAQLKAVVAAGCGEVQGYLFSPPVRGEELPEVLGRISARQREQVAASVPVAEPGLG